MSIVGIPSDKIRDQGQYFSPLKDPPSDGPSWTYRVIQSSRAPSVSSIHQVYYQDGILQHMSCYPVNCLHTQHEARGSLKNLVRNLDEALRAPVLDEHEVVKEEYARGYRCRACSHLLSVYDVPSWLQQEEPWALDKLVSGGQRGADFGGIKAARAVGIPTGGWAPRGYLTEDGPNYELRNYGLLETPSSDYVERTFANVQDSHGTLRFLAYPGSPGSKATLRAIQHFKRPFLDVDIKKPLPLKEVLLWILYYKIKVLNIAGNRESKSPGIEDFVEAYLLSLFEHLK